MTRPKQILTLRELVEAYKSGKLSKDRILWVDNDEAYLYVGDEGDGPGRAFCIYRQHPGVILEEALDLLGIPHEGV